jgi:hypothetical protein
MSQSDNSKALIDALYKKLEASIAANEDSASQEKILAQIKQIKDSQVSQFNSINTMSDSLKKNVSGTLNKFIDEMSSSVNVVQSELDKSKDRLSKIEELKNNKLRMAEINTYYGKQYRENTNTMKTILYVCIPLIILMILKKKELLPAVILNSFITIIVVVGGIIILKKLITNTFLRDNMNYDEIHQLFNVPPGSGPSVIQYDEQQLMGTNIVEDAETDADYLASKLGFGCIGSSCCSPGMSYDETEKKCTIVEPFNNMLSNSYYSVS